MFGWPARIGQRAFDGRRTMGYQLRLVVGLCVVPHPILHRILFCAFCEDSGLLPPETIQKAYAHNDPYNPRPIWGNFRGLFRSINIGNTALNIPACNGGLFASDPELDRLAVPDEVSRYLQDLAT